MSVPENIRMDSLWKMKAYRLGLFLSDLAWRDVTRLVQDRRTIEIADQLYRAVCKISSNVGEGYSRNTGKDRARFYEYALGSAREARDWYYKARHILDEAVNAHRAELTTEIIRLTLTMVARERRIGRKFSDTDE
ncbi:MAG TPA: four helix bundle protein [Nitrospira sp.]|nr:four helix bundle protein [Nitrospira sp.]